MYNYNTLSSQIQLNYQNYFHSLVKDMSIPDSKFIFSSLVGILKSNSCHLTKIGRKLYEKITFKKTVDRLSNHFIKFDMQDVLKSNYINQIKELKLIDDDPIFVVDDSDISKPLSKHLEGLDKVPDGSNEHKATLGYWITEIVALSNKDTPISTYSNLWSTKEDEFVSKNKILFDALEENIKNFGNIGTYTFDRGFDSNALFKFMINNDLKFITRLKTNRNVYINDKKYSIKDLNYKGKYKFNRTNQKGTYYNKLTYTKVSLQGMRNQEFTLILIYSDTHDEPCILLTNRTIKDYHDAKKAASDYFRRWRIEEYFKFKKQEFKFEDIRIRSLNGLKLMNLLINYVITFLAQYTNKATWIAKKIHQISKSIKHEVIFNYYRVLIGIREILNTVVTKVTDYINQYIRDPIYILRKCKQINLFNYKYQ